MQKNIKNFLFPRTNNLQYLAAFTTVIVFLTRYHRDIFIGASTLQSWIVVLGIDIFIALFALYAFYNTIGKKKEHVEHVDSSRMALMGSVTGSFALMALTTEINALDDGTFDFYSIFKLIALFSIVRAFLRVWQFALISGIKDRYVFRYDSPTRKFFDTLARNYDYAYDDRVPAKYGATILIVTTILIGVIISVTAVEQTFQPLLTLIIVNYFLQVFQNKLLLPITKK